MQIWPPELLCNSQQETCTNSSLPCVRGGVNKVDGRVVKENNPPVSACAETSPFTQGGLFIDNATPTWPRSCFATPNKRPAQTQASPV